jgi:SNF2 family DNA or RNA helicase
MGFALPEYEEIPVAVSMSPAQAQQYKTLKSRLQDELKERLIRGDKSLLAGYLQALLSFPDASWRPKVVRDPRTERVVAKVDGLPDAGLFPKEEEIIRLIQTELTHNRKVLLLCQQTGTLDITPQWQQFLTNAGISSAVLKCEPARREAWIEKQVANGIQVIISHPKRVETGLDLLEFPTIIWMGTEYSVYTVLQASRRSWRIGQEYPVKVYFFAYEETLQEDALKLIAAKVSATLRVNGDTVDNDSLAELDELASTDIVTALARIATGQESSNVESLQDAFKKANAEFKAETAVIGSYTMTDLPEPEPVPIRPATEPAPIPPKPMITKLPIEKKLPPAVGQQLSLFSF